jgi:hypothetical protein
MASRRFTDRDGKVWEVIPRSRAEWEFQPVADNPGARKVAQSPGYERDPFELSIEELQRLLDGASQPRSRSKRSPFLD